MVFGFKKKKEVVDFRHRDSDMPIPAKMKEKFGITNASNTDLSNVPKSSSTGGFFSFFGGNNDSISSSSSKESEAKTDFWGNPVSSNSSSNSSSSSNNNLSNNLGFDKIENSIGDLAYRISRITDRLELVEKKFERIERKLGIGGEGSS